MPSNNEYFLKLNKTTKLPIAGYKVTKKLEGYGEDQYVVTNTNHYAYTFNKNFENLEKSKSSVYNYITSMKLVPYKNKIRSSIFNILKKLF